MDRNRRKLLQGSAAVPLILTVRPAAATARTSLSCIDKDRYKPPPHEILKKYEDEWLRKKYVPVYRLTKWNDTRKKWETLEDRRFICGTDGATYWELDRSAPYSGPATMTSMRRGTNIKETQLEVRNALMYVNDHGETGWGWDTKGGYHCSKSCWTSMKPTGY
jgi:hypothetical protein